MFRRSVAVKAPFLAVLVCPLMATDRSNAQTELSFETPLGEVNVELFDSTAPLTVENFLRYVDDGDYENSIVHRSVPGFVIQGGGFTFSQGEIQAIPENPSIQNETGLSNLRGTLAMARVQGDPNSATNQWFINLEDNPELDSIDDGFTVFGQVDGLSMSIVDCVGALQTFNGGGALSEIPLIDFDGNEPLKGRHIVYAEPRRPGLTPADLIFADDFELNEPPFLIIDPSAGFNFIEDGVPGTIDIQVSASDPGGRVCRVFAFTDSSLFTVQRPVVSYESDGSASFNGLDLDLVPNVFGTGTIRVLATDDRGAQSIQDVPITILPANDAPSFSVWAGFSVGPGQFPPVSPPNGLCVVGSGSGGLSPPDCADQAYSTDTVTVTLPSFVQDISPGPFESDNVDVSVVSLGPALSGPTLLDEVTGDLSFALSGTAGASAQITIKASDSQGVETSAEFTVRILAN